MAALQFQSTLPRGSDRQREQQAEAYAQFQSTLPRGSDATASATNAKTSISIHAPSRERPVYVWYGAVWRGFQSTLPRGSDPFQKFYCITTAQISIHAPSRERQGFSNWTNGANVFQSTLPRGSDVWPDNGPARPGNFNPRSLAGATRPPRY